MIYAHIENGAVVEYPVYEGDIRLRYANVSFPAQFTPPEGYEPVADIAPPVVDYTQNCLEGEPILVDGLWSRNWLVSDATPEQIAERLKAQWSVARSIRNARLAASDWTQLPDAPVNAVAWAEYRQELRDITSQDDPFNIVWPPEPGA